jgi:FKBP-type peptidyl-prolyl cis-trans isomerase FklB
LSIKLDLRKTLGSLLLLLAAPLLVAASPAAPASQQEKESYSIGYQVGRSMTADGVQVDMDQLVQGLRDAVDAKEPRLRRDEMKTLIVDLKKRARAAQLKKMQQAAVDNAKESETFLAANKKKPGVQTTASGLQYKIIKEGKGDPPGLKDTVQVDYRGTFINGTEFDSSKGKPATLKADRVIKGWIEALAMMKPGAKWKLFVPPTLAYGQYGNGRTIPPNKTLVFDIDLLSVKKAAASGMQTARAPAAKTMRLKGTIAKSRHGYIIRSRKGNAPSEIYTIVNADPKVLDALVAGGKTVAIEARIVSGDNLAIEKIDGRAYR